MRRTLACAAWLLCSGVLAAPVDVNLANQAELEQIKGLGPQRVEQVLAARKANGPFHDWADLARRIKGIGPATARKLSDAGLVVAGQPYDAAGAASAVAPD
ncbi:MAG: helix-hairpin-helix domain-containing protein [Proteobacteria bacterium]|nr:helix-hairpin-helix domain-containing protein [Pseudomonadota bacterium]